MNEMMFENSKRWSTIGRISIVVPMVLTLGGCLTFLAASNVDLAGMIQGKYEDIEAVATANGFDVEAALAAPETKGAGTVNSLLNEAHEIAGFAAETAAKSLAIEAVTEAEINDGVLQQMALDGFTDDLQEFQQAAGWLALENSKLVLVDQEILSLSGYTDCGGSAIGDMVCAADVASKASSILSMAGISIPGTQALAAFSLTLLIVGEIDKAIQRGRLFGERESRIAAIHYVADKNVLPAFTNLKGNMTSALSGLPEELQPPGWENALAEADAEVNQVVGYMKGLDGLFERYKEEAEANQESLLPGMTPEEMAEMTGLPVNAFRDEEEVAFERLWAGMNEQLTHLESAMTRVEGVRADLADMREANRSGAVLVLSENEEGEEEWVEQYQTTLMGEANDTLIQKLARIEEIEHELGGQFSTALGDVSCPLPL